MTPKITQRPNDSPWYNSRNRHHCRVALIFAGVKLLGRLQFRYLVIITVLALAAYVLVLLCKPDSWLVSDTAVLAAALVVGMMIGSTLGTTPAIIAFCVAAAIVDVISFSGGLTRQIFESFRAGEGSLLIYLSVAIPVEGSVRPIIGIGDFIILAGLYAGFAKVGYHGWLSFTVPVAGLLLALAVGLVIGGAPALPFVAGTTVLYVLFKSRKGPS